jgi:lipopolysaccharide transport system permease protein
LTCTGRPRGGIASVKRTEAYANKDRGAGAARVLVLEPGRAEQHYWRHIWAYRQLFAILAWRDLAVRYKQTVIGVTWALIRPVATMIVFTVVFGKLAKLPSEGAALTP